jgi:hypothetical protein
MRVLLKEGADAATSDSILVLPQGLGNTLETLAGDPVAKGLVAEVDERTVTSALNTAARSRKDEFVSAKDLQKDVRWLNKAIGEYEVGAKIGLTPTARGFALDVSEATRINRADGLAVDDEIAVGPNISPKAWMNAHGRVVSIKGGRVEVQLDPGDRDRLQRATGKEIPERPALPLGSVEKVK